MRGALWWQMGGACPEGSTFPHLQVRRTRCKICCWSLCRFLTLSRLCPGSVAGGLQAQGGLEVQDAMMAEQLSASSSVTVPSGGLTLDGGKIGVNEALPEATLDASAVPEIGQIAFTGRGSSALDVTGAYTESTSRSFTLTITHALHTCKDLCADNTYVACAGDALCQVTEAGCAAVDACEANLPSDATEAAGACEQSAACAFQPQTAQWSSCVAHAVPAVCDAGSFIFSSGVASSLAFGLSATIDYRFVAYITHPYAYWSAPCWMPFTGQELNRGLFVWQRRVGRKWLPQLGGRGAHRHHYSGFVCICTYRRHMELWHQHMQQRCQRPVVVRNRHGLDVGQCGRAMHQNSRWPGFVRASVHWQCVASGFLGFSSNAVATVGREERSRHHYNGGIS